jgi:4a-hydroxytetrahydrobiopterin dehydratase
MTSTPARLPDPEIRAALADLPGWTREGDLIRRTYETGGWRASVLVANAIAFICEAADHHADVMLTWPSVTVSLSTHSAGGITALDLEVARLIEAQVTWRPRAGSALTGARQPLAR